jgi:hypothetical protein
MGTGNMPNAISHRRDGETECEHNGQDADRKGVPKPPMAMAPQPTMTSAKVPMNSATYFFISPSLPALARLERIANSE